MSTPHIHLDRLGALRDQPGKGHNRWHPDIEPGIRIPSGETVEMDCIDAVDSQIKPNMTAADLGSADLGRAHPLTGPVYVEGAEPGDLLAVKVESIVTHDHGFTVIIPGLGYLRDIFPTPFLVQWEMDGKSAVSKQLPGVKVPGAPFMGVMGVAPSRELLMRINKREAELIARGGFCFPPDAREAIPSTEPIASEAMRTIAPHENAGNFDIKQLVAGTTVYIPVHVKGALFSVGDTHFAQGDGETCGTAIETSSRFTAKFDLLKGEATRRKQNDPSFLTTTHPEDKAGRQWYATTGISVRSNGHNESEDLNSAARNALLNMLDYIQDTYGFSREQAYCLSSVAVNLRISQVVDAPNFVVSAFLPTDIMGH